MNIYDYNKKDDFHNATIDRICELENCLEDDSYTKEELEDIVNRINALENALFSVEEEMW